MKNIISILSHTYCWLASVMVMLCSTQEALSQLDSLANPDDYNFGKIQVDLGIGGPSTTFLLASFTSAGSGIPFSSTPVYEGRISAILTDLEVTANDDTKDYIALGLGANYYSMSYEYRYFDPSIGEYGTTNSVLNKLNVGVQGTYHLHLNNWLRIYTGIGVFYGVINGSNTDGAIKVYLSQNVFPGWPARIAYQEFVGGAIQISKNLAVRAEFNFPGVSVLSAGIQLNL